ncbi:MAG: outer membrane protein transport protein [Paraprevotella sp.]|nr:outer membrane protein transport protein [Paraprevotella sp.]
MSSHKLILCVCLSVATLYASAQTNGSNSPYSRFGLGNMKDQSQGFNKGMGGVALGFRDGNRINMQNPASYSAIDSLSFIFDVSLSLQNANFKSGGNSVNAHNTTLDNINAAFRLCRGLGFSFGFIPYSSIGYNFSESKYLGDHFNSGSAMTYTNTYSGDGGLHEVYAGLGWNPFANLSIGANFGYLWGTYEQNIAQTFYEDGTASSSSNGLRRQIQANLYSYKIDVGLQYPIKIKKNDVLTLGATYTIGHTIDSPAHYYNFVANGDTAKTTIKKAFDLPTAFGVGVAWSHKKQWRVGLDLTQQRWGESRVPQIINNQFVSTTENYQSRTKVAIGGEFQPDSYSNKYLRRVQYRLGASFATPYYKINGLEGPREFSLSAGFGLPVSNNISNRSIVNVAFQWVRTAPSSSSLITENYLRLNIGITFNERWFMKWKIQ